MKWTEFLKNPINNKEPRAGVMMIILYRDIRPQPVFSLILSGQSFDPSEYGYAMTDGKVQRDGSIYLSVDMAKLKCWCEQHKILYSFDFFGETEDDPFLDGDCLQLSGDFTADAIDSFPLKHQNMYIRSHTHAK
jgi:hypothetical protein